MEYYEIHKVTTTTGVISMVKGKDKEGAIKKYSEAFPDHEIASCNETNKAELDEYLNAGGLILH